MLSKRLMAVQIKGTKFPNFLEISVEYSMKIILD